MNPSLIMEKASCLYYFFSFRFLWLQQKKELHYRRNVLSDLDNCEILTNVGDDSYSTYLNWHKKLGNDVRMQLHKVEDGLTSPAK
ncbi:Uncharacterized protein TCM_004242 [Theobroma cacao]|uniref:Uncharacterized protein n=1 Tax=Theobroma cacao TaxID=3641 RepID=A0A061DX79_THECC|nr:Uncharacterized protein TCM_004242 [Theobroma cacao]